jgi:adenylate cyclase
MLRFRVVSGEDRGEILVLDKPSVSLGAASDNDICLRDPYISRQHGRIALSENEWVYQDLGSTNGSIVERNAQQLRLGLGNPRAALCTGCLIHLGQTVLEVEIEGVAPPPKAQQHTMIAQRSLADLSEAQQRQQVQLDSLLAVHELEERLREVADPDEMLDMVLEALLDAFPKATHAIILLIDKATAEPRRKAVRIRGEEGRPKDDVPISMSIADRVLGEGESLLFNDVAAEFQDSKSVASACIKSTLCAPLWTGSETVGLLQVESREVGRVSFSEEDLGRLGLFASRAALGIVASELRHAESRSKRLEGFSAQLVPSFIQRPGTEESDDVRVMDASILFSDIRGYTGTAERLSASDTLTMLNTYHASVEDVIAKYGGTIVKTPGDAILAVFWKEIAGSNHATCALKCGEEILDDLPRAARAWVDMGVKLEIGIGINAGQVAAGLVGNHHLEPTVVGDPVNVAQRLESITKSLACPLIFSESIRERLHEGFEAVSLDQVTVSGRETPLRIYSLARFVSVEGP